MLQIFLAATYLASQDHAALHTSRAPHSQGTKILISADKNSSTSSNRFGIQLAANSQKKTLTLEEINADLKSKKAAMEPFDEKKIKVDVESLGLDDLDKKTPEKPLDKKEPEVTIEKDEASPPLAPPTPAPAVPALSATPPPETTSVISKIQNFLHKGGNNLKQALKSEEKKTEATATPTATEEIKKPTEQYINSAKKQNLKKRLEAERRKKINTKDQKERLKKLNELRQKYLTKAEEFSSQNEMRSDEDFEGDEEKIIPQKKELNNFISDEMPALPILNRFRTKDNLHIPTIQTPMEKVGLLFNAISMGSVSFFNDAYRNVLNPNAVNQIGDTILTCATLLQKYSIIASALAKGADPNRPNKLGYTPASIAIETQDMRSFELLANNKADLNYIDGFGRTYLMHAARMGFLPAVDLLVLRGADINAMDKDGFTALSIAYRHRKEVIVQYLLKNGAKTWVERPYDPGKQSLIKELEQRWK